MDKEDSNTSESDSHGVDSDEGTPALAEGDEEETGHLGGSPEDYHLGHHSLEQCRNSTSSSSTGGSDDAHESGTNGDGTATDNSSGSERGDDDPNASLDDGNNDDGSDVSYGSGDHVEDRDYGDNDEDYSSGGY